MGKSAKITRFGSHVSEKRARKGLQLANEGRKTLRKAMKEVKTAEAEKRKLEEQSAAAAKGPVIKTGSKRKADTREKK